MWYNHFPICELRAHILFAYFDLQNYFQATLQKCVHILRFPCFKDDLNNFKIQNTPFLIRTLDLKSQFEI